jgi:hypothetical protein
LCKRSDAVGLGCAIYDYKYGRTGALAFVTTSLFLNNVDIKFSKDATLEVELIACCVLGTVSFAVDC